MNQDSAALVENYDGHGIPEVLEVFHSEIDNYVTVRQDRDELLLNFKQVSFLIKELNTALTYLKELGL